MSRSRVCVCACESSSPSSSVAVATTARLRLSAPGLCRGLLAAAAGALERARAAYLDAAKNSPCHGQQRYFKKLKPHWYRGARRSNEFPPLYERELGARPYDNYTTAPTPQQRTPGHFVRRSPSRINIYTPRFSAFLPFSLFRPVFPSLLLSARGAIFSSRTLAPPR